MGEPARREGMMMMRRRWLRQRARARERGGDRWIAAADRSGERGGAVDSGVAVVAVSLARMHGNGCDDQATKRGLMGNGPWLPGPCH